MTSPASRYFAEVGVAEDRQVRHQRGDEVGLGRAGAGAVEEVDELPARDALACLAGVPVDVKREARTRHRPAPAPLPRRRRSRAPASG